MEQRLLTAGEAAEVLQVSVSRVLAMVRLGLLPPGVAVRMGRQVRISADDLAKWIRAGGRSCGELVQ